MGQFAQDAANVAEDWRQYELLLSAAKHRQLSDEDWKAAFELERAVLIGRIDCLQDAVAKLRGVSISFVQGERVDGADVRALDQVIVWLETQSLTRPPTGIAALLTDMFAPAAQTPPSPRAGDPSRE